MIELVARKPAMVDAGLVEGLREQVNGQVLVPGDSGYGEARRIWNGMIDKRPAVIVRAVSDVDVQRAVDFARDNGLELSIKGGGHNVAGLAVAEGGVMLDMGEMSAVQVDPVSRTARVQGGALWRHVDAATAKYGLATTGGVISSTGVAGLTLGGGIGWLVGKYGMAVDNLLSATVVTASGEIVIASEASHPDLFWAIRGGGGNFGVVTSFEFKLHPVSEVLAGFVAFPVAEARQVLERYRDFTMTAPDELTAYAQISKDPESGERVIAISVFWPGKIEEGERIIDPVRSFGTPIAEMIAPMPYAEWQQLFDAEFPHGFRYYWKGSLLRELDDVVLQEMADRVSDPPHEWSGAAIEWYRGAMNRVDPGATAFAHRDAEYQLVMVAAWDDDADDASAIEWTRGLYQAVAPHGIDGSFLNFNNFDADERTARVRAGYGSNWDRLVEIKRRYDPENLFNQNNNISPE